MKIERKIYIYIVRKLKDRKKRQIDRKKARTIEKSQKESKIEIKIDRKKERQIESKIYRKRDKKIVRKIHRKD